MEPPPPLILPRPTKGPRAFWCTTPSPGPVLWGFPERPYFSSSVSTPGFSVSSPFSKRKSRILRSSSPSLGRIVGVEVVEGCGPFQRTGTHSGEIARPLARIFGKKAIKPGHTGFVASRLFGAVAVPWAVKKDQNISFHDGLTSRRGHFMCGSATTPL